jgi:hypothetical protein
MAAAGSSEILVSVYQISRLLSHQDLKLQISQQPTLQFVPNKFAGTQNKNGTVNIAAHPSPLFSIIVFAT